MNSPMFDRRTALRAAAALAAAPAVATFAAATTASASTAASTHAAPRQLRFSLPAPSGPHPTGVVQLHLVQHGRPDPWHPPAPREIMLSIWYPARPALHHPRAHYLDPLVAGSYTDYGTLGLPAGRIDWAGTRVSARECAPVHGRGHPVLLYSPGGGNSRALGSVLVEDLASHGYVVVTVDHTYETAVQFPGDRLVLAGLPEHPADLPAAKRRYMDAREADALFVLDALDALARGDNPDAERRPLPAGLGAALGMSRLGVFGHSAGGLDAVRVLRAEPRMLAGANLDGFFEFGENHPELGVDRPFLLMGTASNPEQPPLFGRVRTHRSDPLWSEFWAASTGWKLDLAVPAGRHYTFTDAQWFVPRLAGPLGVDPTGLVGTVPGPRVIAAQRAYLRALFDTYLRGRPQRLLRRPDRRYPDVRFVH